MAKLTFWDFVTSQLAKQPPVPRTDLSGQTVIVTGANVGLGFEAAKHFARMRPKRLVIACRNKEKGETALAEIREETGFEAAELMILDLSMFASVSSFVEAFEQSHDRLDILVCNAAIGTSKYHKSPDGWETTIQVNHLSTALLSLRLLPLMINTAKNHGSFPRMTIVSSGMHYFSTIGPRLLQSPDILEKMSDQEYCTPSVMGDRYNLSKLLNVLFARALTEHLPPTSSIVVNTVDPGFCVSELAREVRFPLSLLFRPMQWVFARPTEEGARMLVYGALIGHDDSMLRDQARGAYTSCFKITEESDFVLSKEGAEAQRRIWSETLQILAQVDPQVTFINNQFLTR